jgi:hypothetical protein
MKKECKMAIETYLIEDAEKFISEPEHLEEWSKLVDELELTGQRGLAHPEKSPIPFEAMKEVEQRVYNTLCPNVYEVKDYKNCTIPLRVLSLIALAEREKHFTKIRIWDDIKSPDPIAVGIVYNDPNNEWSGKSYFKIGRWGDELRSFAELKQMAVKRWIEEKTLKLKENISEAQQNLENIQLKAEKHFNGDWVSI